MSDKTNAGPIDDTSRARGKHFIFCNTYNLYLVLAIDDLVNLVEKYRQRTYNEDIAYL